ncbi:sulfotransferase family 2 domain-containing protein [Thermodesulfobacteriota bacterium]
MIKTVKRENGYSGRLTFASLAYQGISRALVRYVPYLPSNGRYNITICHEKKFLWFRVAKVGTRTIFDVFKQAKVNLDAEHPMFCYYPTKLYNGYFKFAFVRNPWDRLVSCWKNKVVDSNYYRFSDKQLLKMQSFENFVEFVKSKDIKRCDHHIRLQSKLIDLNVVDFIGRFERFEEDLIKVTQIIGIEYIKTYKNESKNKSNYMEYYDDRLQSMVADLYRRDINIFQYDFFNEDM